MKTIANQFILVTLCLGMGACAPRMPLARGIPHVDTGQKSILVARVRVHFSSFSVRPKLRSLELTSQGKQQSFVEPVLVSASSDKTDDYFISADVVPGKTGSSSECGPLRRSAPRLMNEAARMASLGGTVLATEERAWIRTATSRQVPTRRDDG